MISRLTLVLLLVVSVETRSIVARADTGASFTDSARSAALASAVTAHGNDVLALGANPGALASLERATFMLGTYGGNVSFDFRRASERDETLGRSLGGVALTLASPLPGKLDAFVLGVGLHLPFRNVLRFRAANRADAPRLALYESRVERTAISLGLAVALFERIQVGYALTLAPRLTLPTAIDFDASREGETNNDRVATTLDLRLKTRVAWSVGLRFDLHERLQFGVRYSEAIVLRVTGPTDIRAGGIRLDDALDFVDVAAPDELVMGWVVRPVDALALSFDLLWQNWSRYQSILGGRPDPAFSDTWNPRFGVEATLRRGIVFRAGYAFEATPVPAQIGNTNLLEEDRHVLALGGGVDLSEFGIANVRLDVFGRVHVLETQRATKQLSRLPDVEPDVPDRQIENLGYPAFRSRGRVWQLGLTLSARLGRGQ